MQIWNNNVTIRHSNNFTYSKEEPFHPDRIYPELKIFGDKIDCSNSVYSGIRQLFQDAGFDLTNINTNEWNPLQWIIKPGMAVLLKPNFVRDFNDIGEDIVGLITHGSIIRAIVDYIYLALKGNGRIIIADAPHDDADFSIIEKYSGLNSLKKYYATQLNFKLEYYDLRKYKVKKLNGVVIDKKELAGDPRSYAVVNLDNHSAFKEIEHKYKNFFGADYNEKELHQHHRPGVHEYCISQTVLDADVIINLPKMKTHKKCGITLSMKNLIGINGNKNYLPHYTLGIPKKGGDQFDGDNINNLIEYYILRHYQRFFKRKHKLSEIFGVPLKKSAQNIFGDTNKSRIRSGNWYGNDTIWRTIYDLNRIILFCDKNGCLRQNQQRNYLSIIDGIIGGEGNGPLACNNKFAGFLILGQNPLATDIIAAICMGFEPLLIKKIQKAIEHNLLSLSNPKDLKIYCIFNGQYISIQELREYHAVPFKPHFGWLNIKIGGSI